MVHDVLNESIKSQTVRASIFIVAILFGGLLVLCSYLLPMFPIFSRASISVDSKTVNFYSDTLALLGAIMLGLPIIIHAAKQLASESMHMDELVALAVIAAIAAGNYQAAGVVAFFLLLANLIETRTALGARASIESLIRISPTKAHRLKPDGSEELVKPTDLSPGDIIRVRPGDNIPADGVIVSGSSSINEANITGESLPVDKSVGDEVFSGTSNQTGVLDIKVSRAGEDTTLGKVRNLILQAQQTRTPIMRLIDRYATWYTPTIIMLAAIVLFFTRNTGGIDRAITMLIVACPCVLILAAPTAMVAALSCAARLGILIKDVSILEIAKNLSAIVFDKTGTLTTGELAVTRLQPVKGVDGEELLKVAASVEQMSKHPTARVITNIAEKAKLKLIEPSDFQEVAGKGVVGKLNGSMILVGRKTWLAEENVDLSAADDPAMAEPEGLSTLYVARDGKVLGWIGLEDRTRPEARNAMEQLRKIGINELVMVTGDRWSVARRVAKEMGCTEVQAEVLPEDKLELVAALKEKKHIVAVVGDGVNDAPALAAGDLSVAMGAAGSDVAINSASIALMNNNLELLPFLVQLSRKTVSVVHQNLIFGICFIVILEIISAMGWITPIIGAFLHFTAACAVVFNSARLVRFGEHLRKAPQPEEERKLKVERV